MLTDADYLADLDETAELSGDPVSSAEIREAYETYARDHAIQGAMPGVTAPRHLRA